MNNEILDSFENGSIWIMLNMPQGISITLDNGDSNLIGPRFRGYKMIPSGYHVIRIGEHHYSMGIYFEPFQMFITKWNSDIEELEIINLNNINKYDMDPYLAMANIKVNEWKRLTNFITGKHYKQGFSNFSIIEMGNIDNSILRGSDLTAKFIDRTHQLNSQDWKYLVGEFQMSYMLAAFGAKLNALDQWKSIIEMICHSNIDFNNANFINIFLKNISWQDVDFFTINIKRWLGSLVREIRAKEIEFIRGGNSGKQDGNSIFPLDIPKNLPIEESDPEDAPVIISENDE